MPDSLQDEPRVLYNFLYKNENIIKSFYSQLFDGLACNILNKSISSELNKGNLSAQANLPFVGGNINIENDKTITKENSMTTDPYDIVTIDVLSALSDLQKIYKMQPIMI